MKPIKNFYKKGRLRFRCTVLISLFMSAFVILLGIYLIRQSEYFFYRSFKEACEGCFTPAVIKKTAELSGFEEGRERLAALLSENLSLEEGRSFYIFDNKGNILLSSSPQSPRPVMSPLLFSALNGKNGTENGKYGFEYALNIENTGLVAYVLDDKTGFSLWRGEIAVLTLKALGAGLILSFFFSYCLAKAISKPVESISEGAKKLSSGAFDTRLEVLSNDEIGELTRAFNEMAKKLGDYEKERREFFAAASHELKTPLTGILCAAQTLDEAEDEADRKRFLDLLVSETQRLERLVGDFLMLSGIDNKKLSWKPEFFSAGEICSECVARFSRPAQNRSQRLIYSEKNNIPKVFFDRQRAVQVLSNVIENAIKYTHDGGEIKVTAELEKNTSPKKENYVIISVKDNGQGIAPEELEYITNRFYRAKNARMQSGTGLGLAVSKEILSSHGGGLKILSEISGENRGTEVFIYLPTRNI